jgi:hypothetical protein
MLQKVRVMTTVIKRSLLRVHWILTAQLGINLQLIRAFVGLPRYLRDRRTFRANYDGNMQFMPCFHDRSAEGGNVRGEYFLQDLLVARMVFSANPQTHVDVGSRVDGFVANVASFREIEVFDIRPISTKIPGIRFVQADLMRPSDGRQGYCDSLSCLHALEHFGLGRYGDPIDPIGFEAGLANMAELVRKHGIFYLSVPIGIERVAFNANRIFDPLTIVSVAARSSLSVRRLTLVRQDGMVESSALDDGTLTNLATESYNLGIFVFEKI